MTMRKLMLCVLTVGGVMMVMVACNASSQSVKESTDLQDMPEVASDSTDSIDFDSISALADSIIADTIIADTIEYEKFDDENISGTTYAGIKRIMECIATGDAKTLAALTIYPIHRKYPLKDITRRRQMIDQFDMVFDEAFREKLQHAKVEEWSDCGWQGYCYESGILWVSEDKLYGINLMSASSQAEYERLVKEEMSSLHPSLQGDGWIPCRCYVDKKNGTIYRIDENNDYRYRLSIYRHLKKPSAKPDVCEEGELRSEGTIGASYYTFNYLHQTFDLFAGSSIDDGCSVRITEDGLETERKLEPIYWLDKVKR